MHRQLTKMVAYTVYCVVLHSCHLNSENRYVLVHIDLPHSFHWHIIFHVIGEPLITGKVVPIDRHLGSFEYFAVISNAAMKSLDVSL